MIKNCSPEQNLATLASGSASSSSTSEEEEGEGWETKGGEAILLLLMSGIQPLQRQKQRREKLRLDFV